MDTVKLPRLPLGLVIAGCCVLMTAAYILFLTATWNQLQMDRARRDERLDDLLDRIPARRQEPPAPETSAVLSVRRADASPAIDKDTLRGSGDEILRPVREQAAENAPTRNEDV